MIYIVTKDKCKHYKGKIYITGEIGGRGNVYADVGGTALFLICYLPVINDEQIRAWIKATGWNPDEWLKET